MRDKVGRVLKSGTSFEKWDEFWKLVDLSDISYIMIEYTACILS